MNRRSFIASGSAGAVGYSPLAALLGAQQTSVPRDLSNDVVDFWVNRVGVPPDLILSKDGRPGRGMSEVGVKGSDHSYAATYGSEPLFLYVDDKEGRVVPAQELHTDTLQTGGDSLLEMKVHRLRLNAEDQSRFEDLSTSGLYVDVQQKPAMSADSPMNLGWSLLGAMLPKKYVKAPGKAAAPAPAADAGMLQQIALPGGAGKTMFACFLKSSKKSPFTSFLTAFSELGMAASESFLPMLALPGLSAPALMGIRALAGKLQGAGGNHHWLFQTAPVDIACTAEAAAGVEALRFRSGHYIVLPKSQAALLKDSKDNLKVIDGFLVPRQATALDVFDAAPHTVAGVSYLSMQVNVKKTRLSGCQVMAPVRG